MAPACERRSTWDVDVKVRTASLLLEALARRAGTSKRVNAPGESSA